MDRQYVGIDFHRRRSVIVRKNAAGEKLSSVRVVNDPWVIAAAVAEAGREPEVVIEATYSWYWIVDWLQAQGATVHLANPASRSKSTAQYQPYVASTTTSASEPARLTASSNVNGSFAIRTQSSFSPAASIE
jgi:hypothetical protein